MTRLDVKETDETRQNNVPPQVVIPEDIDSDMEYAQLNDALDEISNCLDDLERRNAALHNELKILLESNRRIRREFQSEREQ